MNEKKNIDRLFQEKFKDFEIAPKDAVWNRIEKSLPNKKKRKIIPIWWQIGGVAASLALLVTIGYSLFNNSDEPINSPVITNTDNFKDSQNNTKNKTSEDKNNINEASADLKIVDNDNFHQNDVDKTVSVRPSVKATDKTQEVKQHTTQKYKVADNSKENKKTQPETNSFFKEDSKKSHTVATIKNNDKKVLQNSNAAQNNPLKNAIQSLKENETQTVVENSKVDELNKKTILNTTLPEKESLLIDKPDGKESLIDAIADIEKDPNEKEKDDEQNRWSITPNVAPVYFGSLGEGSTIHNQFNANNNNSDINMSYGISGSYAISKKLKVRAGINQVNLNYATTDVVAFSGPSLEARNGLSAGNITYKNGAPIALVSLNTLNRATSPEAFNTKIEGNIDQRFGFIEVPLELEYRLVDRKLGLNLIGGFSTFFLNQNEIYADLNGENTLIGESSNLNNTSFSANFGLGLDYNLSKQWHINLEPQFKYQINTFNNTFGNFRPFFIGVYTGLSFKF